MKKRILQMKWTKRIVLIALLLGVAGLGKMFAQNLIVNSDFESGNTGFITDYSYTATGVVGEGHYCIDVTASGHGGGMGGWPNILGYGGLGKYMLVDGFGGATNPTKIVWKQTVNVTANTDYIFSCQVVNLAQLFFGYSPNPAKLRLKINGSNVGSDWIIAQNNEWHEWSNSWSSGSATQAIIEIYDVYTGNSGLGDDFGLDHFQLTPQATYSVNAFDDFASVCLYNSVQIDVLANDIITPSGQQSGATVQIIQSPQHGTATWNNNTRKIHYMFTDASYSGDLDQLKYRVTIPHGEMSEAWVYVTTSKQPNVGWIDPPTTICAGGPLGIPVPTVVPSQGTGQWEYCQTQNGTYSPIPDPNNVPFSMNSNWVRYSVTNDCGESHSNSVLITVKDAPSIGTIQAPPAINAGGSFNLTQPTIQPNGSPIFNQGWLIAATQNGSYTPFNNNNVPYTYNGYWIRYFADNDCGVGYSNVVQITVYEDDDDNIVFADANVKAICVANWDTNGDGELSYAEAAAVTDLGQVFRENTTITSFEELQYFTGLATISSYAFFNCSNLSGSLYIPNSVTTIGEAAFYYCSGLTGSLTIGNSVTTIDIQAFQNCSGFTGSLTIGNSVTTIGDLAFYGCSGFTGNLTIPNSVIEIGTNPFSNCSGIEQIMVDINNPNYDSRENCNAIIETNTFKLVSGCNNSVILDGVTSIGDNAFSGCSGLTGSLVIPDAVTSIGNSAFANCTGFTGNLVIGNSVTEIGDFAFDYCIGFTGSLTIPDSVTSIGSCAFTDCIGFTGTLTIGTGVTSIGPSAFTGCTSFTHVNYNAINCFYSYNYNSAFRNCGGTLNIGDNVERIPSYIFGNAGFTGNLIIPNSVTSIGESAFENCIGFTGNLTIPDSVIEIGTNPFSNCSGIEQIMVDINNPNYDSRENCNAIIETNTFKLVSGCNNSVILDGVTSIGDYAFMGCAGLTGSLVIPDAVTSIGNFAFANCTGFMGNLVIGNSVAEIGDYAFFRACQGFTMFDVKPETPPMLGNNVFVNADYFSVPVFVPVWVPCETLEAYQNAQGWDVFTNYTEVCPGTITAVALPVEGGTVTGGGFYEAGATCTLTATPNEGFLFMNWIGNGEVVSNDSSYNFIVTGDADFVANFGEEGEVCTLTFDLFDSYGDGYTGNYLVVTDENGISQRLTIASGSSAVYTLPFLNGSHLTLSWILGSWTEDCSFTVSYSNGNVIYHGENLNENFNYEFDVDCVGMPVSTFDVTAVANPIDGGTITGTGQYEYNATCTLTAIANEGYTFTNWTENGAIVSNDAEYSFTVSEDRDLVANFVEGDLCAIIFDLFDSYGDGYTGNYLVVNFPDGSYQQLTVESGYSASHTLWIAHSSHITLTWLLGSYPEDCSFTVSYSNGNAIYHGENLNSNFSYEFNVDCSFSPIENIIFADAKVKAICVANWDTNGDGELSYDEAAAVTDLGQVFSDNTEISSFEELQYFTGLTSIGTNAFNNCFGLTSIEIPNSMISIGSKAFQGCIGLTIIEIPNSVISIESYAFNNCSGLTSIEIPNSMTSIGSHAFQGCIGLTIIEIPNSVIYMGVNPFNACSGLEQIVVDSENTTYDSRENCNAIIKTIDNQLITGCKNTIIPNSVTSINCAFWLCSGLTSIEIPNSVTSIENEAFRGCTSLTSIEIPSSVTFIADRSFAYCSSLERVIVDSENTVYDSRENCNAIIKSSTNNLISGCKNTIIPNTITSIGNFAFEDCYSLTSIEIPNSVTYIGFCAFDYCSNMVSMTVFGNIPPALSSRVFTIPNKTFPVYVPYGTVDAYQAASGWNEFTNYQEFVYTTISGYGEGEGNYRFIASPLVENTAPTAVDNMITETPYDLYRFDQSEDDEWRNYKANTEDFVLGNGQGYLYANAENVNLIFKGTFNEDETKEVDLVYDADASFAGWNLVGNPFPVNAYANRSYYTMNEEGTAIEPVAVSMETAIPACTGVMVMAEAEGETVVFSTEAPEAATNQGCLQIELSQAVELVETPTRKQDGPSTGSGTLHDKAIVSFNAGDRLEKFVFNKENAVISIPQGGKELAIACSDKQGEMPLNFKASKNGEYTLTIHPEAVELDYLHLIDNLTGADVDLLALRQAQGPANYTFEAKTTDYASRFRLVFSGKEADGPSTGSGTFAFVNNGNIIITGVEAGAKLQIVDMTGRVVASCGGHTRCVPTTGMAKGVYVLRLINGDDVKTQKIVIR